MSAIEDWEAYLNEQKLIVGMPGLRPRPSFLVGWAAGYIAGQSGKPIAGAPAPSAPVVDARARDEIIAVASLLAGAVLNYPDFDDGDPASAKPMLDIARRLENAVCAALSGKSEAAAVSANDVCRICGGSGFVDDGEITGSGGVDYENGPVQCVKDCPACAAGGKKLTDWRGGDIAAGTFILKDERWTEVPRDTSGAVVLFHQVGWPQGEPK